MKNFRIAAILGLLGTCLTGLLWSIFGGMLDPWEASTYDMRLRWTDHSTAQSPLLIIGRDGLSDQRFGVGIWDRALFATMIQALGQAGAAVVALDFHFAGQSPPDRGGAASDEALVEAIQSNGTVIIPLPVAINGEPSHSKAGSLAPSLQAALEKVSLRTDQTVLLHGMPQGHLIVGSLPAVVSATTGLGHIAADSDADGVFRRVASYVNVDGYPVPALGVAAAAAYLHVPPQSVRLIPGQFLELPTSGDAYEKVTPIRIPVDDQGRFLVEYAAQWVDGPFPYLSFVDVWDAIEEGRQDELREQVAGKIVILLHAALESDKRRTPLEVAAPGGFVHANAIHTILSQHGVHELALLLVIVIVLCVAVLMAWIWLMLSPAMAIGVGAIGTVGYFGLTQGALSLAGVVWPVLPVLSTVVLTSGLALTWVRWNHAHQIHALEEERGELYRHMTSKEDELEAKTQRIRELEQERVELTRAIQARQQELANQESRTLQVEEDLASLREDLSSGREEQTALQQQIDALQQDLVQACERERATRESLKGLEQQLKTNRVASVDRSPLHQEDLENLREECEELGILTRDQTVLRSFRDLKQLSKARTPMMILGEPGTGKELFAKAVHRLSPRQDRPFIPVNMAAIPGELFESELFGHIKGAFTGAVRDRAGYFEQADGGTLFLDEIGDLKMDQQAKLLRVLQEGVLTRVGEGKTRTVDVRIVSATNRDLAQGIAEGWFREDLFYRLSGMEIRLPPLRERPDDLPLLAEAIVQALATEAGRNGLSLSQEAMEALGRWPWKGNIRELKHCLEKAVGLAEGTMILEEDLRLTKPESDPPPSVSQEPIIPPPGDPKKNDSVLLAFLRQHSFDLQATAETLGWDRSTVMQRLKGMGFQSLVEQHGDLRAAAAKLAGEPGLTRLVEVKLKEYVQHLNKVADSFPTVEAALAGCRKRFKNLPERYHEALLILVRNHFTSS